MESLSLVIDSGSTDSTVDIARRCCAKVQTHVTIALFD
jgi:glycosyltransferase involved in cell wall biosynthesis